MKKKILAVLLSTTMLLCSVTGCGSSNEDTASGSASTQESIPASTSSNNSETDSTSGITEKSKTQDSSNSSASKSIAENTQVAGFDDGSALAGSYNTDSYLMTETSYDIPYVNFNTEEYSSEEEQGYKSVANNPISTFSADVDTASYTNLRRMINDGCSLDNIPSGSVRIEEMLNYFNYESYKTPKSGSEEPFAVTTVIGDCPWNKDAKLLQIGLKTEDIDFSDAPSSNIVFLIDTSGSMSDSNKLPLLQQAFIMLTDNLTDKDRVSIVTYAGSSEVLLEGAKGSDKEEIQSALNSLEAYGSTNGADGINTAYELAEDNFIKGGNNRVILATDGDLNVGTTSESDLKDLVEEKRDTGIYLSVLGFGTGNIKDNKMETLADNGNGNYNYIDSQSEAKKVLVEELGATFVTVAKDVKLQIEFNPAYVKGYRQIGYDNRQLATEDFDDDTKDAGEIGAGHSVTALYEIIPVDSDQDIPSVDMKYQETNANGIENGEWMTLKIRYKEPDNNSNNSEESKLLEYPIEYDKVYTDDPNEDFYFTSAVAEFGLILMNSDYKGISTLDNVRELLKHVDTDSDDYKYEFGGLVRKVQNNS